MAGVPTDINFYVNIYVDGKLVKQVRASTSAVLFDDLYTIPEKSEYVIDKWYSSTAYVKQGNAVGDFWDGSAEYVNAYARYVKVSSQPKAKLYIGDIEIECGASGGGSYDDTELSNRVSALESIDHSKYLTEHQSLAALAKKSYPIFNGGKYTFLNDQDESEGWVLVPGKYEKEGGSSVLDPYSLVFNKKEYGNFNNGVYMFSRGRVYARFSNKFNSDIE